MLSILLMVVLTLAVLGLLGLAVFEAVGAHRGQPSPRLNWLRPFIGPLALAILALVGLKKLYDRRKLACRQAR